MLTVTEIGGFAGAGLAGAAYVPQIAHLVRARCSAGVSSLAFGVWLLASILITVRAIAIPRVLCGPVRGHALPGPSAWPARGRHSHTDGQPGKRAWFPASGWPSG